MSQPQGQQQRTIPQSKEALLKSYSLKLREDTKSMLDNFTEIIKLARIEEESQIARSTQAEQDQYEMQVRAANIVRAGESLMKLVSDLKVFLILNDFPSVNDSISSNTQLYKQMQNELDARLLSLRDELAVDLYELEDEYYSSAAQKELRILKQEETTLVALASRISDQLNRLKVEELALQNMVRLQNEEQERHLRGSMSAGSSKMLGEQEDMDLEDDDDANKADLDLDVIGIKKMRKRFEEEEEEEEEDDDEEPHQRNEESLHQDIEQFVELL